jgi:iron(III) transport system ATP-binding protein
MALSDRVVVMQGGRMLQIGSPEEIYQRPASRAVAAFFGSPNLLDATVNACEKTGDGTFKISVSGNGWQGRANSSEPFAAGEPVVVLVRPENLHLANGSANGADMAWNGKVVESIFRGPRSSITLETGGPNLHIEAPALSGMRVGDNVKVTVPSAGAWAIRPDAARAN